jgi:hypothetical protein
MRVRPAVGGDPIALLPSLFEPACQHPAGPSLCGAFDGIVSSAFGHVQEFQGFWHFASGQRRKCTLKHLDGRFEVGRAAHQDSMDRQRKTRRIYKNNSPPASLI